MDKTVNQKAWFLVLPVFLVVAFSAVLPLMTVVNYSMQDTFGNNQFFWNGVGWFKELLDPSTDLGGRFLASLGRNLFFSGVILAIEVPLGIVVALSMPREGWSVAACLVILALPLLIPWNVVGTIWQIFGRPDIGLHRNYGVLPAGTKIEIGVRPEFVDVAAPASGLLSAKIERIDDLGRIRFARVRVGNAKFSARVPSGFSISGDTAGLIFDPAHIHVYADSRLVEGVA